tara:strand:+ start:1085 stop:1738 length:654 start_codon:yes stop_codon:yes gene_type:complete
MKKDYFKSKPNSLEAMAKDMQIHTNESDYQDKFKSELGKTGKSGIGSMTPKEKTAFFTKIDKMHTAKNEIKEDVSVWEQAADDKEKLAKEAKYLKVEDKDKAIPPIDKGEVDVEKLKGQVDLLKVKLENEKNKAVKPVPNKDTGEVPLSVGIAYKHLRDKMKTETADVPNRDSKEKESLSLDTPVQKDKVLPKDKGKTMTKKPQTDVELNPRLNLSF